MGRRITRFWDTVLRKLRKIGRAAERLAEARALFRDPENRETAALLWREGKRLLSAAAPKRGGGRLRIGLSDPYQTGQAMQLAALLYPIYGAHIEVIPEFEETVLEGELDVRGRIYLVTLLRTAVNLLRDRNLRRLYRKFSGEERKETGNVGDKDGL